MFARPNIHAKGDGEGLGFVPGDLVDKLKPLAVPVTEHIDEFAGHGTADRLLKSGHLKLCPFEYMRGTTWKRSWVIADEVQNASPKQLEMLMGRCGDGTKVCILGDPEQCDLKHASFEGSALNAIADHILSGETSEAWAAVKFTHTNCHRHPIAKESMSVIAAVKDKIGRGIIGPSAIA